MFSLLFNFFSFCKKYGHQFSGAVFLCETSGKLFAENGQHFQARAACLRVQIKHKEETSSAAS